VQQLERFGRKAVNGGRAHFLRYRLDPETLVLPTGGRIEGENDHFTPYRCTVAKSH